MNWRRFETSVFCLLIHATIFASPVPNRTIASVTLEEGGMGGSLTQLVRGRWVLGLSARALDDTRWGWVTAGAIARLGSGMILDAEANLGRGDDDGRSFDYRIVRAALSRQIVPQKLFVEIEDRWIDVDRESGNLVRAGVSWLPRATVSTTASAVVATGGSLDADYMTGRADWTRGRWTFILGGMAGRSAPVLFDDPGASTAPVDVQEVFTGVRPPVRWGSVDLFVGLLRVADEDRFRATVVWSF